MYFSRTSESSCCDELKLFFISSNSFFKLSYSVLEFSKSLCEFSSSCLSFESWFCEESYFSRIWLSSALEVFKLFLVLSSWFCKLFSLESELDLLALRLLTSFWVLVSFSLVWASSAWEESYFSRTWLSSALEVSKLFLALSSWFKRLSSLESELDLLALRLLISFWALVSFSLVWLSSAWEESYFSRTCASSALEVFKLFLVLSSWFCKLSSLESELDLLALRLLISFWTLVSFSLVWLISAWEESYFSRTCASSA